MRIAAGVLVALLVVQGCGGPAKGTAGVAPSAAPSTASSPEGPRRFATVVQLKDAAVAAGFACPSWNQDNVVTVAAESGTCSDDTVLSTYATDADLQTSISNYRELGEMLKNDPTSQILVGPNWIVHAPDVSSLIDAMGGTVDQ